MSYFGTDIHSRTLGPYTARDTSVEGPAGSNHTIDRLGEIKAEVAMIFGIKDTHVSDEGRDLVRQKGLWVRSAGVDDHDVRLLEVLDERVQVAQVQPTARVVPALAPYSIRLHA